ncbi:MAG: hypothetical protein RL223_1352 [Pseudomonadota bacterium]
MSVPPSSSAPGAAPASPGALARFGHFQLLRVVGRSAQSVLWLAMEDGQDQELWLLVAARPLPTPAALQQWREIAGRAARTAHPGLADVRALGAEGLLPWLCYVRGESVTLSEMISPSGLPPRETLRGLPQVLQGLGVAHDGALVHGDLQPWSLVRDAQERWSLLGLGLSFQAQAQAELERGSDERQRAVDHDLLSLGLCLHWALCGRPALAEPDIGAAAARLPPRGQESVRLPWREDLRLDEPLRTLVDRATARQLRQRYGNARTFEQALGAWLRGHGGPDLLPLLLDRVRQGGLLPSRPQQTRLLERLDLLAPTARIEQLAEQLIEDESLTLELLRQANQAGMRGSLGEGSGTILTLRRAVALIGTDGVRRATRGLRAWPGQLDADAAQTLQAALHRVRQAGVLARALRPAGYDAELVTVLVLLQSLGLLVLLHHLPSPMQQVRRLMQPGGGEDGEPARAPLGERAAALAVLGFEIDQVGLALLRAWGFDVAALWMARPLPSDALPPRRDRDVDLLRATASCALELVVHEGQPWALQVQGVRRVEQRYGRLLGVDEPTLLRALGELSPRRDLAPEAAGVVDSIPPSLTDSAVPADAAEGRDAPTSDGLQPPASVKESGGGLAAALARRQRPVDGDPPGR